MSDRDVWLADFLKVTTALLDGGWVIEIEGDTYLDLDTPPALADLYSKLRSIGYANGWFV